MLAVLLCVYDSVLRNPGNRGHLQRAQHQGCAKNVSAESLEYRGTQARSAGLGGVAQWTPNPAGELLGTAVRKSTGPIQHSD